MDTYSLITSHPSQWGPGRTHIMQDGGRSHSLCNRDVAVMEREFGPLGKVTCKNCRRIATGGRRFLLTPEELSTLDAICSCYKLSLPSLRETRDEEYERELAVCEMIHRIYEENN